VALFCNPASGGTFSSTAIEILKWVKKIAVAQAKVTHILRLGKASEKTPKGVIPPSLCEISQKALRKKTRSAIRTQNRTRVDETLGFTISLQFAAKGDAQLNFVINFSQKISQIINVVICIG
jgi:hypothetical protein